MTDSETSKISSLDFVRMIPIDEIKPNPTQQRIYMDPDRLVDLTKSIDKHGILQPILVRYENDQFYLIAGQRRLEAAKHCKLKEVPVCIINGDPLEIGIIENLQRENLHPIDEADALGQLHKKRKKENGECTQEELATIIGKCQNTVSEILKLNNLPDDIRNECRTDSRWTRMLLLKIARKKTNDKMKAAYVKEKKRMDQEKVSKKSIPKSNKNEKNAIMIINRIDQLHKSFERMELAKVQDKRKNEIKERLTELQKLIHNIFGKLENT